MKAMRGRRSDEYLLPSSKSIRCRAGLQSARLTLWPPVGRRFRESRTQVPRHRVSSALWNPIRIEADAKHELHDMVVAVDARFHAVGFQIFVVDPLPRRRHARVDLPNDPGA